MTGSRSGSEEADRTPHAEQRIASASAVTSSGHFHEREDERVASARRARGSYDHLLEFAVPIHSVR